MSFNYVVTAHKPTAVTGSLAGNFTTPKERNLIIAKNTRLEVFTICEEGLKPLRELNIYGRVAVMKKFRYPGEDKDLLFFVTDKYDVAILEFFDDPNEGFEVLTRAHGCVMDPYARPSEAGKLVDIDQPKARIIVLRLYDGLLKIIPLNREAKELRSYNIRMEETQINDMCFLSTSLPDPVLALIHEEQQTRHIKTHVISLRDKEFMKGPWGQKNTDCEADMVIPVDDIENGVLVIGGETIMFHYGEDYICIAPACLQTTRIVCHCQIDLNRYILGGICGRMFVLILQREGGKILKHSFEPLGYVNMAETISYLDNGVVFIGSRLGDSQLIRLNVHEPYITVLETYSNLGPILDMVVVDLEKQGQGQLITCSGQGNCGSLRIIRNGIGIHELASVGIEGIKGIWPLTTNAVKLAADPELPQEDILVFAFELESRLFKFNADEELEQISMPGAFEMRRPTLCASNVIDGNFLQITNSAVLLISFATETLVDKWLPPSGKIITRCACNEVQIALALKNTLVYLKIVDGKLQEIASKELPYEMACLDLSTLEREEKETSFLSIGLWTDVSIYVLQLPSLEVIDKQDLPKDALPRSVLKITFESQDYLLCTLADGALYYYHMHIDGSITQPKRVTLGTQPTTLKKFRSQRTWSVFACSDRPTVIYSSNSKLVFSKVNLRELKHMCSFSCEIFPDSLAFSSENEFIVGTIDAIQKLHIRTVPLGESPKRIAYQEETGTFGVLVCRSESLGNSRCASLDAPNKSNASSFNWHKDFNNFGAMPGDRNDNAGASGSASGLQKQTVGCDEIFSLLIIDQDTFEVLHAMQFCSNEFAASICSAKLGSDPNPYYIVGTALMNPEESDPKIGRIFVLRWNDGKLDTIAEKETAGAPYCLLEFHQKLAAAINSTVRLYSWNADKDLQSECTPFYNVVNLTLKSHGDYILVGDLMRSITLLNYNSGITALEEIGRDYQTNWTSAVEILDEDTFLAAETNMNFYVCKRDPTSAEDVRTHLNEVAQFHLGEMVNVITKGSLVLSQPGDSPLPLNRSFLYGSVYGAVGVLVPIKQELYSVLYDLQNNLAKTIKSVGMIEHSSWRTFMAERKVEPAVGFIDGDLIEQLLDLPKEVLETVAQGISIVDDSGKKKAATPEDLVKLVEDLTRIH